MISLISSLSPNLYFNSLVYDRNIFGSTSKVFGNLQKSSGIFGNFWENIQQRLCDLWTSFAESSEIFGKWSEIFGKLSKTPSSVCLYNKKNITRDRHELKDMNLVAKTMSPSFTVLTHEILFLALEHKTHIFSPPCNILYI